MELDFNNLNLGNFAQGESEEMQLVKALEAGSITGMQTINSSVASGAGLKLEDISRYIKNLNYKMSDMVLTNKMPSHKVTNTVFQYVTQTAYGNMYANGGFIGESVVPVTSDGTYIQRDGITKTIGVRKEISDTMLAVSTVAGDMMNRLTNDGSMELAGLKEWALYWGNGNVNNLAYNGLSEQHKYPYWDASVFPTLDSYYLNNPFVIDCRGKVLSPDNLAAAATGIYEQGTFGTPTDIMLCPTVVQDFALQYTKTNTVILPNTLMVQDAALGMNIGTWTTATGQKLNFNVSKFLTKTGKWGLTTKVYNSPATSTTAPTAPTATGKTVTHSVTGSLFQTADAGNYAWGVTALNANGESAMTCFNAGGLDNIVAGDKQTLQIAAGAGGVAATGFRIYRSDGNATAYNTCIYYPLFDITTVQLAQGYDGSAGYVGDINRIIANTNEAFMIDNGEDTWGYYELLKLYRKMLAQTGNTVPFMIATNGTDILSAFSRMVKFINIGKR